VVFRCVALESERAGSVIVAPVTGERLTPELVVELLFTGACDPAGLVARAVMAASAAASAVSFDLRVMAFSWRCVRTGLPALHV
jgi:hypothetical protein